MVVVEKKSDRFDYVVSLLLFLVATFTTKRSLLNGDEEKWSVFLPVIAEDVL